MKNSLLHLSFNITGVIFTDFRYLHIFLTSCFPYCNLANLSANNNSGDRSAILLKHHSGWPTSALQIYTSGFYDPHHMTKDTLSILNLHSFMDLISLALEESISRLLHTHFFSHGRFSFSAQAAQTLFVIYIRDSIALRFQPFKDVRANCFCASLLRTQIHMPRHATSCIERAR